MSDDGDENRAPDTPPLKRHPSLQPLSREHMSGLIQARNLQRAAGEDSPVRTRAIDEFVAIWRSEIREHFDDEERLLLPLTSNPELRERLLAEHRELRELADRCERNPDTIAADREVIRTLGTRLHDHIRWEERVYFEAVQRDHPEALTLLAHESAAIENRRPGARARVNPACRESESLDKGEVAMNEERLRQPPSDRFAASWLAFDLHAQAVALRAESSPAKHGHRQKTLYKDAGRTVALFVMEAGASLPEHATKGTVTVQVIEGGLSMKVAGEPQQFDAGALLVMSPGVRHDVRATSPAAFLLQVSLAASEGEH
jgi:quercetin dioxygenase-like cupin family protein